MKTYKTLLLVTLSTVLAACSQTTVPAPSSARIQAQEECHGCGLWAGFTVSQFWAWQTQALSVNLQDGWPAIPGRLFPVLTVGAASIGQGTVIESRMGIINLRADGPSGAGTLPMACMSPVQVGQPVNLLTGDGRWSGRQVLFTSPLNKEALTDQGAADTACANTFGPGWQVFTEESNALQWASGTAVWQDSSLSLQ